MWWWWWSIQGGRSWQAFRTPQNIPSDLSIRCLIVGFHWKLFQNMITFVVSSPKAFQKARKLWQKLNRDKIAYVGGPFFQRRTWPDWCTFCWSDFSNHCTPILSGSDSDGYDDDDMPSRRKTNFIQIVSSKGRSTNFEKFVLLTVRTKTNLSNFFGDSYPNKTKNWDRAEIRRKQMQCYENWFWFLSSWGQM